MTRNRRQMSFSLGLQVLSNKQGISLYYNGVSQSSLLFQNECLYSQVEGSLLSLHFCLSSCCSCGSVHWIISADETVSPLMAKHPDAKEVPERCDHFFKKRNLKKGNTFESLLVKLPCSAEPAFCLSIGKIIKQKEKEVTDFYSHRMVGVARGFQSLSSTPLQKQDHLG